MTFAHRLAQRRFGEAVEVKTRDELALLGSTLTKASKELEESEESLKRELAIRSDLGRYLPSELVDQIVRREREVVLGGERRNVTILFADVVAFTPLTEKRPPEEVVTMLNELFTILTAIVFRHGGTVDKFIGDCVMALWGAPTAQEDHAARAVAAAEDMFRFLETGNATWQDRFDITIRLAVGIHSGEAVVGNIGSETRMEYTAIGDVVNVAARLESIARPQQILVTQATRDAAGDDFEYIDAGTHRLAGKEESLQLYEVSLL
jgi:class 3 adenylate cyclase